MAICVVSYAMLKMCQQVPQKLGELITGSHVQTSNPLQVFAAATAVTLGGAAIATAGTAFIAGAGGNRFANKVASSSKNFAYAQARKVLRAMSPEADSVINRNFNRVKAAKDAMKAFSHKNEDNS